MAGRLLVPWLLLSACAPAVRQIRAPVVLPQPIAAAPAAARAAYLRGAVLEARGDPADAAAEMWEAQTLDPESPWLRVKRADLALTLGDLYTATTLLKEATSLDPSCAIAWERLAEFADVQGDLATAVDADEQALRLDPSLWEARADQANRLIASQDLDRARVAVAAWAVLPAVGIPALVARGYARLRVGDFAGAQVDLHAAILLGDADPLVLDGYQNAVRKAGVGGP